MRSEWDPKISITPEKGEDQRAIWEMGHWTPHLIRWQHQLYKLFPTQRREVERLSAKECAETTELYEEEYVTWCAVERMKHG